MPEDFDVRIGPLRFAAPLDAVAETLGTQLEQVGAIVTPGARRPRPVKLKLPVRADTADEGHTLRRQVRQLLSNVGWTRFGLYLVWDVDHEMDGWYVIGGGDLVETDPGITFGEFELELADVFLVGQPGATRPGRRLYLADRRGGIVARDSRGLLYSTAFDTVDLPDEPLVLPGWTIALERGGLLGAYGPDRGDPFELWRTVEAIDGQVVSYTSGIPGDPLRFISLEEIGSVRVWAVTDTEPGDYTPDGDRDPTEYGWTQVLGQVSATTRLAVENGACRVVFAQPLAAGGRVALEFWDDAEDQFVRYGNVFHAFAAGEPRVIELTPERAVIEADAGHFVLRVVLQRGWYGPRIETYQLAAGGARMEYAPDTTGDATVDTSDYATTGVVTISHASHPDLHFALADDDNTTSSSALGIDAGRQSILTTCAGHVVVAQVAPDSRQTALEVAALGLADARAIPVLVGAP